MRFRRRKTLPSVRVSETALADAQMLAEAALPSETGGILLGHRSGDEVIVERFLEVPDGGATPTSYRRRHADAQAALDRVLASEPLGSLLGYVGEWHSHPGPTGPSRRDLRQIRQSARHSTLVALVVLLHKGESWQPAAWLSREVRSRRTRVAAVPASPKERGKSADDQEA